MDKKTITKESIAEELNNNIGFSHLVCEELVNSFIDELSDILLNEPELTLKGFGRFYIRQKKSRPGNNLYTGNAVEVSSRKVLRFKASRIFKEQFK